MDTSTALGTELAVKSVDALAASPARMQEGFAGMSQHSRPGIHRTGAGQLLRFRRRDEREELLRLYRLTGLVFDSVPVSLLTGTTTGTQALAAAATAPATPQTQPDPQATGTR